MTTDQVQILHGNTFVVSDRRGDIEASATDPTGLFSFDTRFLSRLVLTVDGARLTGVSNGDPLHFAPLPRQCRVATGFREQLTALKHAEQPVELTVRVDARFHFADLFEVKDAIAK